MNLKDALVAQQIRHQRTLIGAGGYDDIVSRDRTARSFGDEAGSPVTAAQPRPRDPPSDRRPRQPPIAGAGAHDLAPAPEPLGTGGRGRKPPPAHRPAGE